MRKTTHTGAFPEISTILFYLNDLKRLFITYLLPPSLPLSLLLSSTLSSVLSYTSHSCFFSSQLRETELSASPPECPTSTDEKNEALCFQLTCLPLYISQEM